MILVVPSTSTNAYVYASAHQLPVFPGSRNAHRVRSFRPAFAAAEKGGSCASALPSY
jgi:hypothetical protein